MLTSSYCIPDNNRKRNVLCKRQQVYVVLQRVVSGIDEGTFQVPLFFSRGMRAVEWQERCYFAVFKILMT